MSVYWGLMLCGGERKYSHLTQGFATLGFRSDTEGRCQGVEYESRETEREESLAEVMSSTVGNSSSTFEKVVGRLGKPLHAARV